MCYLCYCTCIQKKCTCLSFYLFHLSENTRETGNSELGWQSCICLPKECDVMHHMSRPFFLFFMFILLYLAAGAEFSHRSPAYVPLSFGTNYSCTVYICALQNCFRVIFLKYSYGKCVPFRNTFKSTLCSEAALSSIQPCAACHSMTRLPSHGDTIHSHQPASDDHMGRRGACDPHQRIH